MRYLAVFAVVLASTLVAGTARANLYQFSASLNGPNERPTPVATSATATCTATLDTGPLGDQAATTINCTFADLTSTANNAHIHGPADANTATGIILPMTFTPATSGTAQATGALTRAGFTTQQLSVAMRNGQTYANIHSVNFPGGEIRGQLLPLASVPAAPPWALLMLAMTLAGGAVIFLARRRSAR